MPKNTIFLVFMNKTQILLFALVTCLVSCRVAKEGSSKLQDKWSDFLDDYPTVEELEVKKFSTLFALK